jgi:hypothetical protein
LRYEKTNKKTKFNLEFNITAMKQKKQTHSTINGPETMNFNLEFIPFCNPPQNLSFSIVVPILEIIEEQYGNLVDMQVSKISHPTKSKKSFCGLFTSTESIYPKTLEGHIIFVEFFPN